MEQERVGPQPRSLSEAFRERLLEVVQDLDRCKEESTRIRCRKTRNAAGIREVQDLIDKHIRTGPHVQTYMQMQTWVCQRLQDYRRALLRSNIRIWRSKLRAEKVRRILERSESGNLTTWNDNKAQRCRTLLAQCENEIQKSETLREKWRKEGLIERVKAHTVIISEP